MMGQVYVHLVSIVDRAGEGFATREITTKKVPGLSSFSFLQPFFYYSCFGEICYRQPIQEWATQIQ